MEQLGWVAGHDGNVSVRINGQVTITPSGVRKGDITPDMLAGEYVVSSEAPMHLRCYAERPDIGAVIHAHSPYATAFAAANKPIDGSRLVELALTIGDVPVAPYAPPGTEAVGDVIAPLLARHDVILLQNHGAVAVGRDLYEAFCRMETLELCAKTLLYAGLLENQDNYRR
jgi:L-fuculose-phosphate aldolase